MIIVALKIKRYLFFEIGLRSVDLSELISKAFLTIGVKEIDRDIL